MLLVFASLALSGATLAVHWLFWSHVYLGADVPVPLVVFFSMVLFLGANPGKIERLRTCAFGPTLRAAVQYTAEALEDTQFDPAVRYVYAFHPHGFLCFSEMLTFVFPTEATPLGSLASLVVPLVSAELLMVPVLGHLAAALGCCSVERESMQHWLQTHSVAVTPGGVREIMDAPLATATQLVMRRATGFLRVAQAANAAVVPILVLGEDSCYRIYQSWGPVQRFFIRAVGYPFPVLAFGRWGTIWPRQGAKLTVVFGNPIDTTAYDTSTELIQYYYETLTRMATAKGVTIHYLNRDGTPFAATDDAQERSETRPSTPTAHNAL